MTRCRVFDRLKNIRLHLCNSVYNLFSYAAEESFHWQTIEAGQGVQGWLADGHLNTTGFDIFSVDLKSNNSLETDWKRLL